MPNIKNLFILLLTVISLNASMQDDVVYVENLDSEEKSLKDEFFNNETVFYTLSIGTLTLDKHDPIEFFRTYQMKNALGYKFGKNKKQVRVISGLYKTGTEATADIKNLDPRIQKNKPYSSKLKRHQLLYKEANGLIQKTNNLTKTKINTPSKNQVNENKNSIYISQSDESKELKKEFLTNGSKYYSIALGSISLRKSSIENFFNTYNVADKALAHIYGKNKDKARIIYGLYRTSAEAKEALRNLNNRLKKNKPYSMRMKNFQSFYKKSFPNGINNNSIVEFKVNNKKDREQAIAPKISNEIKILKKIEKKKVLKVEEKPKVTPVKQKKKNIEKPVVNKKTKIKKLVKKKELNKRKKENINADRFLKHSSLEDVYFIESDGNFNILNEVFLNEGSSFYTVDLGELKLDKTTIEEFFLKNKIEDNALSYKYGTKNEYARAIYGAYETKEDASKVIKKLNIGNEKLRVSNIKNHQKLYKEYHKDGYKQKKQIVVSTNNTDFTGNKNDIVFYESANEENLLKTEFFNRESPYYTITLITFLKDNMSAEEFLRSYDINDNAIAYSIGSANNYYRVIYGVYRSSQEAKNAIENLTYQLRRNTPYVSKVITNQRKFESYNNRVLENEMKNSKKIEF